MATSTRRQIQDQYLNILYSGPTPVQKIDPPKADKKTRLAGRKVLNDISNSRKLSSVPLNPVKKDGSTNVISIEKDPVAAKAKIPKATEKGKFGGRKALTDVTNSVKLPAKQGLSTGRKLMKEEGFLHNHQECIKAQANAVDVGYFLKSVGLNKDMPMQKSSRSAIPLSSKKHLIMEEMMVLEEDEEVVQRRSPACRSPQSPRAPYMSWDDDRFSEFMMIQTPKLI